MLNYFGSLIKPAADDFQGIETSTGVVVVSNSSPDQSNKDPADATNPKEESREEFDRRREEEQTLDTVLQNKFSGDIAMAVAEDMPDLADEPMFRGSKELDIILAAADYLKDIMLKAGTKCLQQSQTLGEVDISIADKSQLVVMVYKELREEQKTNMQLKSELEGIRAAYDDKLSRIEELQHAIGSQRASGEALSAKLNEANKEKLRLEQLLARHMLRYKEMCNMESSESFRLATVCGCRGIEVGKQGAACEGCGTH